MTDFADAASDAETYFLDLAMRQHASRCQRPTPLPDCEYCESTTVHVFSSGVKSRFCADCIEELREHAK